MKTAAGLIIERLAGSISPLAIHELDILGVSQTSASARLRELKRVGLVESVPVKGKRYTAWKIKD
jgi:DNA-binding transcriptional regulator GbsR (MarR family)